MPALPLKHPAVGSERSFSGTMRPGPAAYIEYLGADDLPWRAALQAVRFGLVPGSVSDPSFQHSRATSETQGFQDPWIQYKSNDGTAWSAQCRAQASPATQVITFEFALWRRGAEHGPAGQVSPALFFLDWDGRPWIATIGPMNSPGIPEFILQARI